MSLPMCAVLGTLWTLPATTSDVLSDMPHDLVYKDECTQVMCILDNSQNLSATVQFKTRVKTFSCKACVSYT